MRVESMFVHSYYIDSRILQNSIIIGTDDGFFMLHEKGILQLTELPPSAEKIGVFPERPFWRSRKSKGQPCNEHFSTLIGAYASNLDTVFFFETGAVIDLVHNDCRFLSELVKAKFYSPQEAKAVGLLIDIIDRSPIYFRISKKSQSQFAEPVETSFCVFPGILLSKEPQLFPKRVLREATLSVDFVMNYVYPRRSPEHMRQLWQIPSLFSAIARASFNQQAWDAFLYEDYLPNDGEFTFYLNDRCVAEMLLVNVYDNVQYFPYNDSFAIIISCLCDQEENVNHLVKEVLARQTNMLFVPAHLCHYSE